jgi:hypothetical protein
MPAVEAHPVAQSREPMRGAAAAVVAHGDVEVALAVAELHFRARGPLLGCRLERVLDHPVGGEVDARQRGSFVARHGQVHLDALRAHALDECRQTRQARLRRELGALTVVAEHAEQAAHLRERLAAGGLDLREGLLRSPRLARLEGAADRLRLDDDRAHRVGHLDLQLGGDALALLVGGDLGTRLPGRLGLGRLLAQFRLQRQAPAEGAAGEERRQDDHDEPENLPGALLVPQQQPGGHEAQHDAQADPQAPAVGVATERVEHHEQPDEGGLDRLEQVAVEGGLGEQHRDVDDAGEHRVTPPPGKREHQRQRGNDGGGATAVRLAQHRLADRGGGDDGSQQEVDEQRVERLRARV